MRNSGAKRLRAGFPHSWCIGDKTETSDNGAMGDNCHCVAPDLRSHSYRRLFGRRNPMMHSLRWPGLSSGHFDVISICLSCTVALIVRVGQPFPVLNKAMCVAGEQSYLTSDARSDPSAVPPPNGSSGRRHFAAGGAFGFCRSPPTNGRGATLCSRSGYQELPRSGRHDNGAASRVRA